VGGSTNVRCKEKKAPVLRFKQKEVIKKKMSELGQILNI
jgi:hypothetical protein